MVTLIEYAVVIGFIVYAIWYIKEDMQRNKAKIQRKQNILNSIEFNQAIIQARRIKLFFEDAVKLNNGHISLRLNVLSCDPQYRQLNCPDEYNHLLYFRAVLGTGYERILNQLKNGNISDVEKRSLEDAYLKGIYGKTRDEIVELGINWSNLIYDVESIDHDDSLLYYKFYCPCELMGDERKMFSERI